MRRVLTAPTITTAWTTQSVVELGQSFAVEVHAEYASSVELYLDDGDGQFQPTDDLLIGTDHDSSDGWRIPVSDSDASSSTRDYRILPLGDSITSANGEQKSYRFPLWQKLLDAGIPFDFVGSQHDDVVVPDYKGNSFDADHEGHYGWRADEILQALPSWLDEITPDIVLMHLGTNDVFDQQPVETTMAELGSIIKLLRQDNPEVAVFVAKLLPTDFFSNDWIDEFNAALPAMEVEWNTPQSPVVLVDQNSAIDPAVDLYDGVHPGETGEQKMADVWEAAIRQNIVPLSSETAAGQNGFHVVAVNSRGDVSPSFTLDLLIESDEQTTGDFDANGSLNAGDIDMLFEAIREEDSDLEFDLNSDRELNRSDVAYWLSSLSDTTFGDVNLDGAVNFSDFLGMSASYGKQDATWADGDQNGDRTIDFRDFLLLTANFSEP